MKTKLDLFAKFLHSSKKAILLVVLTAATTLILSSIAFVWLSRVSDLNIPSIGTIRTQGVEAYWDSNLTNKVEACDWGVMWPGALESVTIYLRSTSNIDTILNLTTGNWTFWDSNGRIIEGINNRSDYMDLTWNYSNTVVHPGEALQVMLTLKVDNSYSFVELIIAKDMKKFSFDISIMPS